jgi:phosphatidylserine/phosphatidylglycerophosphate/cardiolipin synthase-like enzyme
MDIIDDEILCSDAEDNYQVVLKMLKQADCYIDILAHELEPKIYDNDEIAETLENIALENRYSQIRILVNNAQQISYINHRVLKIGRNLSSFFKFRRLAEEDRYIKHELLIVDRSSILKREYSDSFMAKANLDNKVLAKQALDYFDKLWANAEADPYLGLVYP